MAIVAATVLFVSIPMKPPHVVSFTVGSWVPFVNVCDRIVRERSCMSSMTWIVRFVIRANVPKTVVTEILAV